MSNSIHDFDKVESYPDVSAAQQLGMALGDETQPRTLYVGNLDIQMTEEFLMVLFGQIGQIRGCKIIHEPNGDPYAFLEFFDHTAAAAALGAMNRRSCFGKEMRVNWATSPNSQSKPDTSISSSGKLRNIGGKVEKRKEKRRKKTSPRIMKKCTKLYNFLGSSPLSVIIIICILLLNISMAAANPKLFLTSNEEAVNFKVTKGDGVVLVCGHPNEWLENARVTWFKEGVTMEQEAFPGTIMSNLNLHFEKVGFQDSGMYACCVKVFDGKEWKDIENRKGRLTVLPRSSNSINRADSLAQSSVESSMMSDKDEESGETMDRNTSCELLEETLNLTTTNEPYLCFDNNKKKKLMTHFLAKPAGSTVTIFCNVRGNPKPTITWYKDDMPFNDFGYQHKIIKHGLSIQDSNPSDSGIYRCEASNNGQTIYYETEYKVIQRALSMPIFEEAPTNLTQVVGSRVELRVKILSDPEYSLVWIKNSDENPYTPRRVESRTNDLEIKKDNHVLVLENATLEDEGWYTCVAGNSIGRSMRKVYLRILTEVKTPPSISTAREQSSGPIIIYATVVASVIFAAISVGGFVFYRRIKLQQLRANIEAKNATHWIKQIIIDRRPVEDNDERSIMIPEVNIKNIESNKSNQEYELPVDVSWEFPREKLTIGKHLGEGAFGEVRQGVANGLTESGVKTTVAIKSLKRTHTDAEMIDLISEMETMKELGKHTNIINLLGCCTQGGELLVIMEFAEHGNLRDFLRNNRYHFLYEKPNKSAGNNIIPITTNTPSEGDNAESLTFTDLMSFAYQVAKGMEYLVQRKYVHRDLAARNILVSNNKIVKIADFGMTRSTFTNDYYRKKSDGRVPVKWMAPETLFHRIYTTQSDVWSYGVLLWEIVTLGGTPYPSMPDVNKLLDFLKSGRRMEQPSNCPTELYLIMRDCWMESPSSRPSFNDLVEDIGRILYIASGNEYMDLEGVRPLELEYGIIETPPSSAENSAAGIAIFDPEFVKSFLEP